jgi:hypothetical protein
MDSLPTVFATGELQTPDQVVELKPLDEFIVNESHAKAISIEERRRRFVNRKKLTRRHRPHRRVPQLPTVETIVHESTAFVQELLNPQDDDGSDAFVSRHEDDEISTTKIPKQFTFPPYFDARIAWGQQCHYPLRNQGSCGSCFAISVVDTVSHRACIAACFPQAQDKDLIEGNPPAHFDGRTAAQPVPDWLQRKPPPLALQPALSCIRSGRLNQCEGGIMINFAHNVSRMGLIMEGDARASSGQLSCCPDPSGSNRMYDCQSLAQECRTTQGCDATPDRCQVAATLSESYKKQFVNDQSNRSLIRSPSDVTFERPVVSGFNFFSVKRNRNRREYEDEKQDSNSAYLVEPEKSMQTEISKDLVKRNVMQIKFQIMRYGPVVATMKFNGCAFKRAVGNGTVDYEPHNMPGSDEHKQCKGTSGIHDLHSIKVIGWATIGFRGVPTDVWIIQNSWGGQGGGKCLLSRSNSKLVLYDAPANTDTKVIPMDKRPTYPAIYEQSSESGYYFVPMLTSKLLEGTDSTNIGPWVEVRCVAPSVDPGNISSSGCSKHHQNNSGASAAADLARTSPGLAPPPAPAAASSSLMLVVAVVVVVVVVVGLLLGIVLALKRRGGKSSGKHGFDSLQQTNLT